MSRGLKFLLVLSIILIGVLPLHAQGNLSDEERAQVEKAYRAVAAWDSYDTYVEHRVYTISQHREITKAGETLFFVDENRVMEVTAFYIQGEKLNTHVFFDLDVKGTTINGKTYGYTVAAEARLVDGVLYVKAERKDEEGDIPDLSAMPDGWITFESREHWPALSEDFGLDDYLPTGPKNSALLDELENLVDSLTGITVTSGTLDDGTPVDYIAMTSDVGAYFRLALGQPGEGSENSAQFQAILNLMDPANVTMTDTIALDKNGIARRKELNTQLIWTDLDMGKLDSRYLGMMMDFTMQHIALVEISAINEPLDPAIAPAMR